MTGTENHAGHPTLADAARTESARIYGTLCPQWRPAPGEQTPTTRLMQIELERGRWELIHTLGTDDTPTRAASPAHETEVA